MTDGFVADPEALARSGADLAALQDAASRISSRANSADPNFGSLGLFGEILYGVYGVTVDDAHTHLGMIKKGLDAHAERFSATARAYGATDAAADHDFSALGAEGGTHPDGAAASIGGYDVLRFDAKSDIPLVGSLWGTVDSIVGAAQDGATASELGQVGAAVSDLAANGLSIAFDPLNYVISAGLGFLVDVIQPLEDLLGLLTGNPEWTGAQAETWAEVAMDLQTLGTDIATTLEGTMQNWTGDAAETARDKLAHFTAGVLLAAQEIAHLAAALELLKALMEVAQAVLYTIIAAFVEWLILTWITAIALEVPSFGSSTVAATLATEAEAGVAVSRGVAIADRVALITEKLGTVFAKLKLRDLSEIYEEGFKGTKFFARTGAAGMDSIPGSLTGAAKGWDIVTSVLGKGGSANESYYTSGDDPSDADIERELGGG